MTSLRVSRDARRSFRSRTDIKIASRFSLASHSCLSTIPDTLVETTFILRSYSSPHLLVYAQKSTMVAPAVFGPEPKPAGSVEQAMSAFDNVPLFMKSLPEEGLDDPAMSALQSLVHEGTPDGMYGLHPPEPASHTRFRDCTEFQRTGQRLLQRQTISRSFGILHTRNRCETRG